MESARCKTCFSGQRHGPAAPREDKFPSPSHKPSHISTTPTTRGRKCRSPGSTPPRRVWKPQPNYLIANWLRLMETSRGESCPSGHRRGLTAPGEDRVFPRIRNPSISLQLTPTTWGRKRRFPGSILPRTVWKPQPHRLVADWLGLMEPARGENCLSEQPRGPATPGEDGSHPRIKPLSISLQLQQPGDENADPPGRCRPTWCENPNQTGWSLMG